jgi:hypothetical protein
MRVMRAVCVLTRCSIIFIGLMLCACSAAASDPAGIEFFERQVRPILVARCHACHGPEKQESDFRLDSAAGVLQGGVYGVAVVPGRPDESRLVSATSYTNEDLQMPPKGPLPEAEKSVLRRWVEMGAPWPEESGAASVRPFDLMERKASHWAWQPVQRPVVPGVREEQWPRGAIDRFVLARLEERGLRPAPDADRRTLIRRLYLDLTGLPPTPREVADFLADDSSSAFADVVDRLLASPRFGERWARHWFDVVRYAETYGHEQDFAVPHAWQYRDYVMRALNADVPYDQFVMEHVAGDLMNAARLHPTERFNESVIATGFWFMYEQTHAPTDVRQHEADRVDNQIDVMTKAFLGITVGCARCHDHKFDAISTRDYYALAGFLKSSRQQIALLDPHGKIEAAATRLHEIREEGTNRLQEAIPQPSATTGQEFATHLLAAREVSRGRSASDVAAQYGINLEQLSAWTTGLQGSDVASPSHPIHLWTAMSMSRSDAHPAPRVLAHQLRATFARRDDPRAYHWLVKRGERLSFVDWYFRGWAFAKAPSPIAGWDWSNKRTAITRPGVLDSGSLGSRLAGTAQSPTFVIPGGQLHVRVRGHGGRVRLVVDNYMVDEVHPLLFAGLIAKVDTAGEFKWITIKGDLGKYIGERAYLSVEDDGPGEIAIDEVVFTDGPPPDDPPSTLLLAELETAGLDSAESLAAAYGKIWNETLSQWHSENLDAAHAALLNWVLQNDLVDFTSRAAQLADLRCQMEDVDASLPEPMKVLAMADGSGQDERVYLRGKHQNLGDEVPRRFLEALSDTEQPAVGAGCGRLELARRIVNRENPLFARAAVNRIWHHLFGRGIVPTVDNLGVQGEPPSHPELLDWLADEFANRGWSQKQLIRDLVLSRTYQMSSRPDEAASEQQDPANLLWHRANVRRLEGEAIRDSLLAVSGRLDDTMFGPSVPAYISPFAESNRQPATSGPLDGDGRRSVYLEVRRNFLPQMMVVFDTPTPFTAVGRRTVSNVPAQALAMLNDPLVTELATHWAKWTLKELPEASPRQRIERMYETALCRLPTDAELNAADAFIDRQADLLRIPPAQRDHDVRIWSDFAHVLFNHKEFVLRN